MSNAAASNDSDGAGAQSNSDTLVIVSSVLEEFHHQNSPDTIASTTKILTTLLRNAIRETTDPEKRDMYRKVRLANPKIQQHIVNVKGALDILGLAGFIEDKATNGEFLVHEQQPSNAFELYLHDDDTNEPPANALIHAICDALEAKLKELEPWLQQHNDQKKKSEQDKKKDTASNANSPFLSEEERLERQAKIKAMKKAKEAERTATKERWKENMEDRKEAKRRREELFNAKVQEEAKLGLASGITIRSATAAAADSAPKALPKPFAAATDPASQKEQLAAAARARIERAKATCKKQASSSAPPPAAATGSDKKADTANAMDVEAAAAPAWPLPMTPAAKEAPKDTAAATMKEDDDDCGKDDAENWGDKKLPAKTIPPVVIQTTNLPSTAEWKDFVERVPRCAGAEGIRESSYFQKQNQAANDDMSVPMCLKRLFKELDGMQDSLPSDPNCSIWLRFDEETPQYIRALLAAPLPGPTPYSGGLFCFDIYIPGNYPQVSPKVQLLTTGGGKVRFGPNLYADGKVCLSLLGTWPGPCWNPQHSSLYQVLISIQGLLLGVEHPYFLEPGHGGWEGKVKEGDFQQQGKTLAGKVVREEVGVPMKVIVYEDALRVATVKYAMLQTLKSCLKEESEAVAGTSQSRSNSTNKNNMLAAFGEIIHAHFAHNREAILSEVRMWMSDHAHGRDPRQGVVGGGTASLSIDELNGLLPKLEQLLSEVQFVTNTTVRREVAMMVTEEDSAIAKPTTGDPHAAANAEMDEAKSPSRQVRCTKTEEETASEDAAGGGEVDVIEQKRMKMRDAATKGDYVSAGQLQEEVKRLEDLQRSMKEAAKQNDFIRAGRLQAQFKALTATDSTAPASTATTKPHSNMWNQDDPEATSNSDGDSMDDDGMPMGAPPNPPGMGGSPPFAAGTNMGGSPPVAIGGGHHPLCPPHGLGKNVFAPPGFNDHMVPNNHAWGTGSALGNSTGSTSASASNLEQVTPAIPQVAGKKSIPPHQLCRLRIRLPEDKSVMEDFDKNDQLSVVYRRLAAVIPEEDRTQSPVAGPASNFAGAFAQPLSSAGFTLLLTRPKREFSLEMHGTRSLVELNLAPSATLTVMRCSDRGIMHRGELESRLQQAQGNAMDVDGLTYEGLMELTERVGTAAPQEGAPFVTLSHEDLEKNSETFSPSAYLAELDNAMEAAGEDERRCPVCLGSYDATDTTATLRKINCGHIFHSACLETWLGTKSSCPLCKTSIRPVH